jgi:hypothetical protein
LAAASKSRINHANESEDRQPERIESGYYTRSATEYLKYRRNPEVYRSISNSKFARQIEKDERFWTAAPLMAFKYSEAIRAEG